MLTNTIIIGVAGAGRRTGCTHLCLVLANFLKKKGLKIALLEKNDTKVFFNIAESEEIEITIEGSFFLNNLDFYISKSELTVPLIISRPYEYLIIDYGDYLECDKNSFSSNTTKIITCGSKLWEFGGINMIFEETHEEILKSFHYCFSFASNSPILQKEIAQEMDELENIYFPHYTEDPFINDDFEDAYEILGLPINETTKEKKKRNILKLQKKKKEIVINPSALEEINTIEDFEETEEVIVKESKGNLFSRIITNRKVLKPEIILETEEDKNISYNIAGINSKITHVLEAIYDLKVNHNIEKPFIQKQLDFAYKHAFCISLR